MRLNLQIYIQKPALLSEFIRRNDVHVNVQQMYGVALWEV